jgi:hypothetical protein
VKQLERHPEEAARLRAAVSKDGNKLGARFHPSRSVRDFLAHAPQDDGRVCFTRSRAHADENAAVV